MGPKMVSSAKYERNNLNKSILKIGLCLVNKYNNMTLINQHTLEVCGDQECDVKYKAQIATSA